MAENGDLSVPVSVIQNYCEENGLDSYDFRVHSCSIVLDD